MLSYHIFCITVLYILYYSVVCFVWQSCIDRIFIKLVCKCMYVWYANEMSNVYSKFKSCLFPLVLPSQRPPTNSMNIQTQWIFKRKSFFRPEFLQEKNKKNNNKITKPCLTSHSHSIQGLELQNDLQMTSWTQAMNRRIQLDFVDLLFSTSVK